ncbi:MAG TPA: cytochrome c biogenesis protein CcdA [Stellaceae bacterium]|nr:cytochrome c biogenesis protein CcdA [Stellaceae bacterium]
MEHLGTWLAQGTAMSLLAVAAVALAGLLVGLAPSSLPLYSVVAGYVGGQAARRTRGLLQAAGFVLGMATVDAALGALFGFLGFAVLRAVAGALALTDLLLAALLLVLGLALLRKIRIVVPVLRPKPRQAASFAAAYALGVPFGLSACPACTPMTLPILGAAASTGTPWLGGVLLFVFGLARGVPLLVVGGAADMARRVPRVTLWVPAIERAGGVLFLIAALYFLYQSGAAAGLVPPLQVLL